MLLNFQKKKTQKIFFINKNYKKLLNFMKMEKDKKVINCFREAKNTLDIF